MGRKGGALRVPYINIHHYHLIRIKIIIRNMIVTSILEAVDVM